MDRFVLVVQTFPIGRRHMTASPDLSASVTILKAANPGFTEDVLRDVTGHGTQVECQDVVDVDLHQIFDNLGQNRRIDIH